IAQGKPGPGPPGPLHARKKLRTRWGGRNFRIVARMASRPMLTGLAVGLLLTLVLPAAAAPVPSRTGDGVLDVLLASGDMEKRRGTEDLEEFDRISGAGARGGGRL